MRIYLDEMISPTVAAALRARGHDSAAVVERSALGAPDPAPFARAMREQRALVTYNIRDFAILARAAATAGRDHWGLVLIDDRHLPPSNIGALIDALATLSTNHSAPDALKNTLTVLRRAQP